MEINAAYASPMHDRWIKKNFDVDTVYQTVDADSMEVTCTRTTLVAAFKGLAQGEYVQRVTTKIITGTSDDDYNIIYEEDID